MLSPCLTDFTLSSISPCLKVDEIKKLGRQQGLLSLSPISLARLWSDQPWWLCGPSLFIRWLNIAFNFIHRHYLVLLIRNGNHRYLQLASGCIVVERWKGESMVRLLIRTRQKKKQNTTKINFTFSTCVCCVQFISVREKEKKNQRWKQKFHEISFKRFFCPLFLLSFLHHHPS